MAEYIERGALLKEIGRRKSIARTSFPKQNFCVNDVLHCIYDAHSADVVEVRHGKWTHIADYGFGNCIGYCSACGVTIKADSPTELKMIYNYCPNCGAKMDGKGEGE